MDEAGAPSRFPLLNCGQNAVAPLAPYSTTTPLTCDITGIALPAAGVNTYDGTAGRPNVFQGRQVSTAGGTGIQFLGVPLDPGPLNGTSNARVLRITNLRVNAAALGITGTGGFANAIIFANVTFNATNFAFGAPLLNIPIATVRGGLLV